MKVLIEAPDNLYFPLLLERSTSGKVIYPLKPMTATRSSVEIQKAVWLGYKVLDIHDQHHFPKKSNTLFAECNQTLTKIWSMWWNNQTFFAIKRQAKLNGNKGLEAIAKLCINSPYGKWSYNPTKAKGSRIVTEPDDFFWYLCGAWNKVSINIINEDVAMAAVQKNK